VREACELMIGLSGNYDLVISERANFSSSYKSYLELRKAIVPIYYTSIEGKVAEVTS